MIEEKTKKVYTTPDGKEFESEEDAWEYCKYMELNEFFTDVVYPNITPASIAEYICENWEDFVEMVRRHS